MAPGSSLEIRRALPADAPLLWELLGELSAYEKVSHMMTGSAQQLRQAMEATPPRMEAIVGWQQDEPVGFATYFEIFHTRRCYPILYLHDLYVRPAHRGGGLGRRLFEHVAQVARQRGCGQVRWLVAQDNLSAIDFYQKLGAQRLDRHMFAFELGSAALD